MKVNEIFLSIEGEGIRAGKPAVFIRLFGCNLDCTYCDSVYSCKGNDYTEMTPTEIYWAVEAFHCPYITLTGGEPLIHKDVEQLLNLLCKKYEVNIETNGSVDFTEVFDKMDEGTGGNIIVTMDWKSYSSGMAHKMNEEMIRYLTDVDVLKFVVGNNGDLEQMREVVSKYSPECHIFVSPVFGKIEPKHIVDYLIAHQMWNVRVQLQLHKFIWDPEMRGV